MIFDAHNDCGSESHLDSKGSLPIRVRVIQNKAISCVY